jgi:uncharacterized phage protein (TIGR01671 family)
MNRELKFRAWDKKNQKMVIIGELRWKTDGTFLGGGDTWYGDTCMAPAETWTHNIMQFTGLTDRNGKEIWEGDVVKIYTLEDTPLGEVKWDSDLCSYMIPNNKKYIFGGESVTSFNSDRLEVISNIYENTELIN